MQPQSLALGMVWYVVFLFSTTCHEGAHALAAKLGGDPTAFEGGQVSLNPLPHIRRAPMGTVVVPILSFLLAGWMVGWANAPYDPNWQRHHPRRAAWMALAGPAANFVLMGLAAAAIRLGMALGSFHAPATVTFTRITEATNPKDASLAATFVSVLFVLNLVLGVFNLLPVPPLDGNAGATLLMSDRVALKFLDWTQDQRYGLFGLLIAWMAFARIFPAIFALALNLLYPGARYG